MIALRPPRPRGIHPGHMRLLPLRELVQAVLRLLPALLPALLFVPIVLAPPMNHDVAAVLNFSERWLNGERLYVDLIDVNPPLIYVLNLAPALLAQITPLDAVRCLQLCLFLFGAAAWRLAVRVRDRAREGITERALLDALPALFLFCGGYDFGQREHLMAVASLPYIFAACRRADGERPRGGVAIGVLAALCFLLKPHFLAVPALIEIAVLVGRARHGWASAMRRTWRDPLILAMAGVSVIYAASLPLLFADYLDVVVPLVWDFYVDLGGLSVWDVMLLPRMATVLLVLLPALIIAYRPALRPQGVLPRMLALAALGALASALAQHKGWSYHIVPIEMFSLALGLVLAARWLDVQGATRTRQGGVRAAGLLVAVFALYVVSNGEAPWKELEYSGSDAAGLADLLGEEARGERVLVLSPGIWPIFPALNYADVHLTLREMNMWLLEGAYQTCLPNGHRYREIWEMGRPEFYMFRTVAEDFARAPPAAVVVDKQPGIPWCGAEFDFIAYFTRHPLFAEVWSHYELAASWGHYQVFTRKD